MALYKTYDVDDLHMDLSQMTLGEMGQYPWMPLESITGKVGPKSDLYSIGDMLRFFGNRWDNLDLQLLTGRLRVLTHAQRLDHDEVIEELRRIIQCMNNAAEDGSSRRAHRNSNYLLR